MNKIFPLTYKFYPVSNRIHVNFTSPYNIFTIFTTTLTLAGRSPLELSNEDGEIELKLA